MAFRPSPLLCLVAGLILPLAPLSARAADKTLSFVIFDWANAVYQTRFADECPSGLNLGNDEFWWRGLTREDRARLTNNGLHESGNRYNVAFKRGPNQENVCLDPTAVTDPFFRPVEGDISFGENIDGTEDGRATPKTCAHQKFTSPDGTKGVDNQMYRLIGCIYGWRDEGLIDKHANELRAASGLGMILIDITGVSDRRNDDDVTVTFYRSIDQFALNGASKPLPFATYRIDTVNGKPRYGDSLKGRIKDGVLTTNRGDVRLPYYGNYSFLNPVIRDMAIRLEIADDESASPGMITGYYSRDQFVHYASGLGGTIPVSYFSCPGLYAAAHKLADGYPDPKTGECTMLSSAFRIAATPAFILHPEQRNARK